MSAVEIRSAARRPAEAPVVAVWVIAAVALLLVTYFDTRSDVVLLDEWARRWTLTRWVGGHGFSLWGINPGLVQMAVAAPLAFLHVAPRYWRLTGLPFLAMAAWYTMLLCRRLGADRFWSTLGGVLMICCPITLGVATGLMNETVFLGLFAASIYHSLQWVEEDRARVATIVLAILATYQRPQAAVIAVGVTAALVFRTRGRVGRKNLALLLALLLGTAVAYKSPGLLRSTTVIGGETADTVQSQFLRTTVALPILLGLVFLPLTWALTRRLEGESGAWTPIAIALAVLAALTLVIGAILFQAGSIFPGDWFNNSGIGPVTLPSSKGQFWPLLAFIPLELLVVLSYHVLLVWRRGYWNWRRFDLGRTLLLFYATSQFAPVLVHSSLHDRYYLMVALPLVPLVVAMIHPIAGAQPVARYWALGFLAVGVLAWAVGEQDYIAWHVAADQAVHIAHRDFTPAEVDAGFEMTALYIQIPAVEDPHSGLPTGVDKRPRAALVYAGRDDPRPGVTYDSLTGGKIVVATPSR